MLKLFNTLTRKKQIFKPIKDNEVRMYVCGPTVNDVPHLGHARQQITFDVLRKYMKFLGFKVKYVSNITDIDDKIINKANELGISIKELTEKNIKAHLEDYRAIGVEKPDAQPKATEYVKEMINLIKILEEKGYTYLIEGDGVYYNISKFKGYGKLSHQNIEDLKTGARIKIKEDKINKEDFALWKFSKEGEPSWESPWGNGRPGWHIECSAMSKTILGLPIDIHGGGQDLIFPHHEDEIAQSEAAYDTQFSRFWVHNGMVNVEKVKMSKSLGNFTTIKDLLKKYDGKIIRYLVISAHYRKPIDFSTNALDSLKNAYEKLKNACLKLEDDGKENEDYLGEFEKSMNDDLNTPNALAILWNLVRDSKANGKYQTIAKMDKVFGLDLLKREEVEIPEEVQKLAELREKARKEKNWKEADRLRDEVKGKGFIIEDSSEGIKIKKA